MPTITEFYEINRDLVIDNVSARTAYVYENAFAKRILPALGDADIREIKTSIVRRFMNRLREKGCSDSTRQDTLAALSRLMTVAYEDDVISANPCVRLRWKRKREEEDYISARALTLDELKKFLAFTPDYYRPMCEFLVLTGLRFGEMAALAPSDFNHDFSLAYITHTLSPDPAGKLTMGPTKSRKRRTIVLPYRAREIARKHAIGKNRDDLIFTGPKGGALNANNFSRAIGIKKWRDSVHRNIGKQRPLVVHDLRHTTASSLLSAGVPINAVQEMLGHASVTTTQLYVNPDLDAITKASQSLDDYFKDVLTRGV